MSFTGSPADINTALDGLLYDPTINFNGSDTLSITVDDGNTVKPDSVALTIAAVNDPPQNLGSLPASVTVDEDLPGDVDLSLINLFDVDASSGILTVTLATTGGGTLSAAVTDGFVTVGGTTTSTLTLDGTVAELNTFLNNASAIQFTSLLDANGTGADSINVSVNDNGNVGSGPAPTILLGNVSVDINAVNDAPTVSLPAGTTVLEDDNVDLGVITVGDVDAAARRSRWS